MTELRLRQDMKAGQIITVDDSQKAALLTTGLFEEVTEQSRPPNPADAQPTPSAPAETRPARPAGQNVARNATQPRQDKNAAELDREARTVSQPR